MPTVKENWNKVINLRAECFNLLTVLKSSIKLRRNIERRYRKQIVGFDNRRGYVSAFVLEYRRWGYFSRGSARIG